MKAANIEAVAPRSVVLKTTTLDETLAADAIMIRSHYSLTNTGTELARFTGLEAEFSKQFKYPFVMGWANVGTVMGVGGAVADIAEGSVVLSFGPHASVFKTGRNRIMGKVPDGLDPAVAIFARMGAVSITALRKADLAAGDKVLVIGQGIVGHLAAQLFRIAGAEVMVTDVIESRLHAAREAGIVDAVNPSTTCLEDAVAAWTGGKGPRIVVEAVGSAELICTAVRLAARHHQYGLGQGLEQALEKAGVRIEPRGLARRFRPGDRRRIPVQRPGRQPDQNRRSQQPDGVRGLERGRADQGRDGDARSRADGPQARTGPGRHRRGGDFVGHSRFHRTRDSFGRT